MTPGPFARIADAVHQVAQLVTRSSTHPKAMDTVVIPNYLPPPYLIRTRVWHSKLGYNNGLAVQYQGMAVGSNGDSGKWVPTPHVKDWIARRPLYIGGPAVGSPTQAIPSAFAPTSAASTPGGFGKGGGM